MQLAQIIKGRRSSLRLTQKVLGTKAGVLPKTLSVMENAPGTSRIDTLFKLLSGLDLELILQPKESVVPHAEHVEW